MKTCEFNSSIGIKHQDFASIYPFFPKCLIHIQVHIFLENKIAFVVYIIINRFFLKKLQVSISKDVKLSFSASRQFIES